MNEPIQDDPEQAAFVDLPAPKPFKRLQLVMSDSCGWIQMEARLPDGYPDRERALRVYRDEGFMRTFELLAMANDPMYLPVWKRGSMIPGGRVDE